MNSDASTYVHLNIQFFCYFRKERLMIAPQILVNTSQTVEFSKKRTFFFGNKDGHVSQHLLLSKKKKRKTFKKITSIRRKIIEWKQPSVFN
jgi:hypothetical protein